MSRSTLKKNPDPDPLKSRLLERIDNLRMSAEKGASIDIHQLRELERLERLIRIEERHRKKQVRRWPLAVAAILTILVTGILVFLPLPRTEIGLEALVGAVEFTSERSRQFTSLLQVESLSCDFLEGEIPPTRSSPGRMVQSTMEFSSDDLGSGKIMLAPISTVSTQSVRVKHISKDRAEISFSPPVPELGITVVGHVRIKGRGLDEEVVDFGRPRAALLRDVRRISLATPAGEDSFELFQPHLPVSGLQFTDRWLEVVDDRVLTRHVSAMRKGRLSLDSLQSRVIDLKLGSWLELGGVEGELRAFRWQRDGLGIYFDGSARRILTGRRSVQYDITPSCLEWLHDRLGLKLVWGSAVWLLSLGIGVLRWWKGDG